MTYTARIYLPLRTQTESNSGGHWAKKAKRAKLQRGLTAAKLRCEKLPELPVVVRLTRCAPGFLDSDNLPSATKHVRDGIADVYGVDDRSEQYEWIYDQARDSEYGVEIRIFRKAK